MMDSTNSGKKLSLLRNSMLAAFLSLACCLFTVMPTAQAQDMYAIEVGTGMSVTVDDTQDALRLGVYTYEFWLKDLQGVTGSWRRVFRKGLGSTTTGRGPLLSLRPNDLGLHFDHSTGSGQSTVDAVGVTQVDQWMHIAMVLTALDGDQIIYLDGIEVARRNIAGLTETTQEPVLQIGSAANVLLDDFRIWNYAKTEVEIREGMGQELKGTEEGLVGYWKFNDGEASTAIDSSPSEQHATVAGALWSTDVAPITVAQSDTALGPIPANAATDVWRDVVLGWSAGEFAQTHNVYFGTDWEDVNAAATDNPLGVLASEGQTTTEFDPGRLEFSQTYHWRVDEVNGPPNFDVFKGKIWSFTVEPLSYPVTGVSATGSSAHIPETSADRTVDGSGLDAMDQHGTNGPTMWLTAAMDTEPWIQYEFDQAYKLHEMWVWNSNQSIETLIGFGVKDVNIEISLDGSTWTALENVPEFTRAPGLLADVGTKVDFGGQMAKFVKLTIETNWGVLTQTGLSEVRFFAFPAYPRNFSPANESVLDSLETTLSWRNARQTDVAKVLLSMDQAAVADGSAVVETTGEASYAIADLDYGSVYFWQIIDTNDVAVPTETAGPILAFLTPTDGMIDDMEIYKDEKFFEIWSFWADGYDDTSNGSIVGNGSAPETEQVYEGSQSMPMTYDNSSAPKSEATRTFDPPVDLAAGNADNIGVYFKGVPYEFNGYYSEIGPDFWTDMQWNPQFVTMSDDALIGMAVTSHDVAVATEAVMSNLVTSGNVTGNWTQADIGGTHPTGLFSESAGTFTISALGSDIWNAADDFRYVYKDLSGEGSLSLKLESLETTNDWTKAGPMIRDAAVPEASFAAVYATGTNGTRYQARLDTGINAVSDTDDLDGIQEATEKPVWLKIERKVANGPAEVYLKIMDTSNKSVKVAHPDPAATRLGNWTLLSIPLSELSGVNLASIKSISVGVEGAGAVGKLFVDYLRLNSERQPHYDLFAHYALDGDAKDSSGNGFDGVVSGDPTYIDGVVGQGLEFDGTTTEEYVTIGNVNPSLYSGQLSISLFTKWYGLSGQWQGIIGKRNTWAEDAMMWDVEVHQSNGTLYTHRNSGQTVNMGEIPVNEWFHVGATYDGSSAQLYKDGTLAAEGAYTFGPKGDATLVFGCAEQGGGNPYNGALDEIRIYDRKLTADEVAALAAP